MKLSKNVTIRDVAARAGVSTMTVTRAFRGERIATETCRRVMTAATELGYHPNIGARIFRGGKTMSVGILFSNPVGSPIVRKLSEVLLKHHYISYIADTLGDPALTHTALQNFTAHRVDAIVMQYEPAYLPLLSELVQIPNLVLTCQTDHLPLERDCCFYGTRQTYREILKSAKEIGRKNLWTLGRSTFNGFRQLFQLQKEIGIPIRHCETRNYPSAPHYANHADALRDLLKSGERPDGIFAMYDIAAAQAIRVLHEFNLRVPEDVFVIGSGNDPMAQFCDIPIASIDFELAKVAGHVVDLTIERLKNPDSPVRQNFSDARFVCRKSADFTLSRNIPAKMKGNYCNSRKIRSTKGR